MIKIFNFRKILKKSLYLFIVLMFILIIFIFSKTNSFALINENHEINKVFYTCLNDTFNPLENKTHYGYSSINQFILSSELSKSPFTNSIFQEEKEDINNPENSELSLASDNSSTEQIEDSIPLTYTNEYNGVLINNSSNYDLTYEMLDPSSLTINKNNVIIFHTHTCESYTQTEKSQYEESRKLQNYRFKFFCSKGWRCSSRLFNTIWF